MLTCTFFGHRDTPKETESTLRSTLVDLIENKNVHKFYVDNHGSFDYMVKHCLIELKRIYPIDYAVVLAYFPDKKHSSEQEYINDAVLPDGIESVPRKFAINYRNRWMIEHSDYVITYVERTTGGAARFKELAEKKKKTVINLAVENVGATLRGRPKVLEKN